MSKIKNPKNISVKSTLSDSIYINFDEDGLFNISLESPTHQALMHVKQWVELNNIANNENKTVEELLKDHFDVEFEDE